MGSILKSTTMFYPKWTTEFNVTDSQISVVYTAILSGGQIGGIISGFLECWTNKQIFSVCSALSTLSLLTSAFVPNIYLLAVTYGLASLALGVMFTMVIGFAAAGFSPEIRSLAISIGVIGTAVGSSTMPIVIQLLFDKYTVRQSMFIISGVYAHTFIGVALTPEVRKTKKKSNVKLTSIMNPSIVIYVIALVFTQIGKQSQFPYFVPLANQVGVEGYDAASILFWMGMLDIPCRVAGGYFSSLGFVRKMGQSVFVGIMVLCIGILNLASVFIIEGYWSFTIWAICFGLCYALPVSSQYSAMGEFTHIDNISKVLSFFCFVLLIGVTIAPVITGFLVEQFCTYEVTFIFAGVMMCMGGTSAIIARCIHGQSEESKEDIDQSED